MSRTHRCRPWPLALVGLALWASWAAPASTRAQEGEEEDEGTARIERWIDRTIETLEEAHLSHLDLRRGPLGETRGRTSTGTSWTPTRAPIYGLLFPVRRWGIMVRGNVFLGYGWSSGKRGARGLANGNTLLVAAIGPLAAGEIVVRGVLSSESYAQPKGSPAPFNPEQDLPTDRQRPRSLVHELALTWTWPRRQRYALQAYGAVTGSPALGPPDHAFRSSAFFDPVAPLVRSIMESTRVSPGVLTLGIQSRTAKLEASYFRAPDDDPSRHGLDLGRFDSGSVRAAVAPNDELVFSLSYGRVHDRAGARDRHVMIASALWADGRPGQHFSAGILMGASLTDGSVPEPGWIVEGTWQRGTHHTLFGRIQARVAPENHYIDGAPPQAGTGIGSLAAGYVFAFRPLAALAPGLGVRAECGPVAPALRPAYGGPVAGGFTVFAQLRQASLLRRPERQARADSQP